MVSDRRHFHPGGGLFFYGFHADQSGLLQKREETVDAQPCFPGLDYDSGHNESAGNELPVMEPVDLEFLYLAFLRISGDKGRLEAKEETDICQVTKKIRAAYSD